MDAFRLTNRVGHPAQEAFTALAPRVLGIAALLAVAGCGDDGSGPNPPANVVQVSGSEQIGLAGVQLARPFVILVTDASDAPVAGVTVDWAVTAGSGILSAISTTSGSNGQATTTLTPTQVGRTDVRATVAGLSSVLFIAIGQAEIGDPTDDTFATDASAGLSVPDIVRMTSWPKNQNLMVEIEFTSTVVSLDDGGPNVVVGFMDIDWDQNEGTGFDAITDSFREGPGSTGLGVEYLVRLGAGGAVVFSVSNVGDLTVTGAFVPTFTGNLLTMTIPLSLLNDDDGLVNLAMVMGTLPEATDIGPNDGHLSMGPVAPAGQAVGGSPSPRVPCRLSWRSLTTDPGLTPCR